MTALVIAGRLTPPNVALHDACDRVGIPARLLPPELAAGRARLGEMVLGRVDVLPSLNGPEPGLDELRRLERAGVLVLNRAASLQAAHDKLVTARLLASARIPHPRTALVLPGGPADPGFEPPYVLKPRFGSWGKEVVACDSRRALRRALSSLEDRSWFGKHGALVQELIPNVGLDLRVVVAGGAVVGAVTRVAGAGEWRTNVALGGHRAPAVPSAVAKQLAVSAAAATGGDLVGVDLLPTADGFVVLEVNGCVDFTADYSLGGGDVFEQAVVNLVYPGLAALASRMALPEHDWSRKVAPLAPV